MKEKILIINASPRKNGNSSKITKFIIEILQKHNIEYEKYDIYEMNIEYCIACGHCEKTKGCIYADDMSKMYSEFDKSIGTIIITPIHFNSVSAKLKTVIDRTQAIYSSKFVLNDSMIDRTKKRKGLFIAVGGSKSYKEQMEGINPVIDLFFKSINTKLKNKILMENSDEIHFEKNSEFNRILKENIENYL